MIMTRTIIKLFVIAWFASLLSGCATINSHLSVEEPDGVDAAIEKIVNHLATHIQQHQGISRHLMGTTVVLDPFIDSYSQQQNQTSRLINAKITALAAEEFNIQVIPLQSNHLNKAGYAIHGAMFLDVDSGKENPVYHFYAIARSIHTGEAIASIDTLIQEKNLDYTPLDEFQDNPVYTSSGGKLHEVAPIYQSDKIESKAYQTILQTQSLLNEAGEAYAKQDYSRSLALYKAAMAGNSDNLSSRIYAGLYINYLRMEQKDLAKKAFTDLTQYNLENDKSLAVKLLFKVNSTDFINDPFLIQQYNMWLRIIGVYFDSQGACLNIEGHSSNSGSAAYNEGLSQRRAETIQASLQSHAEGIAKLSTAIGKGFRENIVGLGTDDARDAIDRRVEFVLRQCEP